MPKTIELGQCYAANIDWNDRYWQGLPPGRQRSGFGYVADGGVPAESWNLDFDNRRNSATTVYGYVKRMETAKPDVATVFLTSKSPEGKRFIVGIYGRAQILRAAPWKCSAKPRPDGGNSYVNLAVLRKTAAACARPWWVEWDIERHYGKSYRGTRQWPGRSTFLKLTEEHARALLGEMIEEHERRVEQDPTEAVPSERLIAIARALLGGTIPVQLPKAIAEPPEVSESEVVWAERQRAEVERILRYAPQLRRLKDAYEYVCQVDAGHRLELPNAAPYVEVHHIEPVSEGGVLADPKFSNCLVLCPSCHVLFQSGALWLDPADGRTICHYRKDRRYHKRQLKLADWHELDRKVLKAACGAFR